MGKMGFKIEETPITWEDKAGSKVDLNKVVSSVFLAVVKLRLLNSPFGYIVWNFTLDRITGQTK